MSERPGEADYRKILLSGEGVRLFSKFCEKLESEKKVI